MGVYTKQIVSTYVSSENILSTNLPRNTRLYRDVNKEHLSNSGNPETTTIQDILVKQIEEHQYMYL